jgi:hypothetical protein
MVLFLAAGVILSLAQSAAAAVGAANAWVMAAALALTLYLGLRFSLTGPASVAEGRLAFLSSWRLTRDRTLTLAGMIALNLSLLALLMAAITVGLALVAAGAGGLEAMGGVLSGSSEAFRRHPGVFVLCAAVEIVLTPVTWILTTAPLAVAYRSFAGQASTFQQ